MMGETNQSNKHDIGSNPENFGTPFKQDLQQIGGLMPGELLKDPDLCFQGAWQPRRVSAVLVLADGTVLEGRGHGAEGSIAGEVCFNTSMTGYQEILTDPSYSEQIVTFTFPHIGNVGTNEQDGEDLEPQRRLGAVGAIFRSDICLPSNYRAIEAFDVWLKRRGIIALSDIDTRALTALIRQKGALNGVIAHNAQGEFNLDQLRRQAAEWDGLEGLDLASKAGIEGREGANSDWRQTQWRWLGAEQQGEWEGEGHGENKLDKAHIVVIDYGVKRNILRLLATRGARLTIVGTKVSARQILDLHPDGIFLSNGPGDPAATGQIALPTIHCLIDAGLPIFGICLGHQMLALALGGKTVKMHQGHHGGNHPVKDFTTGKVEIVSMNHGFAVDGDSLPDGVEETHISLFDGSNCGITVVGRPVFSVQHHPEASPGPQDSYYLFDRFFDHIQSYKDQKANLGRIGDKFT